MNTDEYGRQFIRLPWLSERVFIDSYFKEDYGKHFEERLKNMLNCTSFLSLEMLYNQALSKYEEYSSEIKYLTKIIGHLSEEIFVESSECDMAGIGYLMTWEYRFNTFDEDPVKATWLCQPLCKWALEKTKRYYQAKWIKFLEIKILNERKNKRLNCFLKNGYFK